MMAYVCRNMSLIEMNMTRGCPCTPQVMCGLKNGYYGIINEKACGAPRSPPPYPPTPGTHTHTHTLFASCCVCILRLPLIMNRGSSPTRFPPPSKTYRSSHLFRWNALAEAPDHIPFLL